MIVFPAKVQRSTRCCPTRVWWDRAGHGGDAAVVAGIGGVVALTVAYRRPLASDAGFKRWRRIGFEP